MSASAAEQVIPRLLACGVSEHSIVVGELGQWQKLAKHAPGLWIWDLSDPGTDVTNWEAARGCADRCLTVRIVPGTSTDNSCYTFKWDELTSADAESHLRLILSEAKLLHAQRAREHWYRMAVMEGNIGLWWWDQELNFVHLSEHFQQMLNLTPDTLPPDSQQWLEMIHPADRAAFSVMIEKQFGQHAAPFHHECRIKRKDGEYRWYALSGHCQPLDQGGPRILGAAIDVTEKKEAELKLSQATQQAQSANRAKTEFLTNMSHNLRTPLTAVLGFAEMLNDFSADQTARDAVQSIRENSQHLMRLLDDILELSRGEHEQPSPKLSKTSIDGLLCDTVETFHVKALQKDLAFTVFTDPQIPPVLYADASRVRQILGRLLENAIKFTDEGEVSIEVNYLPKPVPTLEFIIADTGTGIPADHVHAIFDPFQQGDNSTSRNHAGSGLGLSICQRQIKILNGSLSVESQVKIGSRFSLRLPIEIPSPAPASASDRDGSSEKPQLPSLAGYRYLLVEDGIDNQRLIKALLQKAGAVVAIAENGQIALDWISEARRDAEEYSTDSDPNVDVVIMDMQMPVLDGYQATQALRQMGFHKPIVALTAHALQGDRERCLEAGCDDYFTKPITRENLLQMAQQYAQQARQIASDVLSTS
ncbi:ATP-binding protein [Blastopirellula marina]|nr:ATP-binding protein [Blastopirellula marina]